MIDELQNTTENDVLDRSVETVKKSKGLVIADFVYRDLGIVMGLFLLLLGLGFGPNNTFMGAFLGVMGIILVTCGLISLMQCYTSPKDNSKQREVA